MLTGDAFTRTFPEIDTTDDGHGSSSLQGTVVAIYEIGCFFGAIFTLFAGEWLGRRMVIMIGCVVLTIGAVLQASAFGIPQMIVGRIVAGLGNGMNTATIPVSGAVADAMLRLAKFCVSGMALRAHRSHRARKEPVH